MTCHLLAFFFLAYKTREMEDFFQKGWSLTFLLGLIKKVIYCHLHVSEYQS